MVVELDEQKFDSVVGGDKYVVVEFYTKWCGYCKVMAPEYERFHEEYLQKRPDVVISRIDGEENQEILYRYGVGSFPTIVLFKPHERHISNVFRMQRVFAAFDIWMENTCPKLEIEVKLLEEKPELIKPENLDSEVKKEIDDKLLNDISNLEQSVKILEINKTEVQNELESIKKELLFLRTKIEEAELETKNLRNLNSEITSNVRSVSETVKDLNEKKLKSNDDIIITQNSNNEINDKPTEKIIKHFKKYTIFDIFTFIGVGFIILALVLIVKRIFFKQNLVLPPESHPKV